MSEQISTGANLGLNLDYMDLEDHDEDSQRYNVIPPRLDLSPA